MDGDLLHLMHRAGQALGPIFEADLLEKIVDYGHDCVRRAQEVDAEALVSKAELIAAIRALPVPGGSR